MLFLPAPSLPWLDTAIAQVLNSQPSTRYPQSTLIKISPIAPLFDLIHKIHAAHTMGCYFQEKRYNILWWGT
jgi:hypothetical protein